MHFKVIILDFDGTIVESVGIKDEAFKTLYEGYPALLDQIMDYHLAHNATIRFKKFKYISENILHEPYSDKKEQFLSDRFSQLVKQKIIECPFVPGAIEFLSFFQKKLPLYLVSMSPKQELNEILEIRGLKSYFKEVYAFPLDKSKTLKGILHIENCSPDKTVFIGDTVEDYKAAQKNHIPFLGRKSSQPLPSKEIPIFPDFSSIHSYLIKIFK